MSHLFQQKFTLSPHRDEKLKETLAGENGKIKQLCDDYGIERPIFTERNIHQISNRNGKILEDITSESDNEITADFITAKVREFTANDDTSLHVSIAGGRKTMTYYLGYAMSVFGRIQDNMSHVLVEDQYISPDFFYPTPQSQICQSREGEFDAKDVTVMLGYLPYIRLRDKLTNDLLNDKNKSYSEIIEIAQRQLAPKSIELRDNILYCSGLPIDLPPVEQSFYCWLLDRHKKGKPSLSFNEKEIQYKNTAEYLEFYKLFSDQSEHWYKLKEETFKANEMDDTYKYPIDAKYAGERRSKINKALEKILGKPTAAYYLIQSTGKRGSIQYHLSDDIKPEHIHIKF